MRVLAAFLATLLVAACAVAPPTIPPPPPMQTGAAAPAPAPAPAPSEAYLGAKPTLHPTTALDVFYAWDHNDDSLPEIGSLEFGKARVSVEVKSAGKFARALGFSAVSFDVNILGDSRFADQSAFFREIRGETKDRKELLVFVHGFNNSRDDAIKSTAILVTQSGFSGVPVAYAWPSQSDWLLESYTHASQSQERSQLMFKNFLLATIRESGAKRVHLAAHSMGNRMLLRTLAEIGKANGAKISNVVMFSPDVGKAYFRTLTDLITKSAESVMEKPDRWGTVYASKDLALGGSKWLSGIAKVGDVRQGLVTVPGVVSIDATDVDSCDKDKLHHSFFRCMGDELHRVFVTGTPPSDKIPYFLPSGKGWRMVPQ